MLTDAKLPLVTTVPAVVLIVVPPERAVNNVTPVAVGVGLEATKNVPVATTPVPTLAPDTTICVLAGSAVVVVVNVIAPVAAIATPAKLATAFPRKIGIVLYNEALLATLNVFCVPVTVAAICVCAIFNKYCVPVVGVPVIVVKLLAVRA